MHALPVFRLKKLSIIHQMETLLLRVLVVVCAVGLTLECGAGGGGGGDSGLQAMLGGAGGDGAGLGKCSRKDCQWTPVGAVAQNIKYDVML